MREIAVKRDTSETKIFIEMNLDGTGRADLNTGVPFLDHMLDQIARHGMVDLKVHATGDTLIDDHHTVEDVGIRERLYEAIGSIPARKLLAERFPKGSATEEIEMLLKNDSSTTVNSICDVFINEMIHAHHRMIRKQKAQIAGLGLL